MNSAKSRLCALAFVFLVLMIVPSNMLAQEDGPPDCCYNVPSTGATLTDTEIQGGIFLLPPEPEQNQESFSSSISRSRSNADETLNEIFFNDRSKGPFPRIGESRSAFYAMISRKSGPGRS